MGLRTGLLVAISGSSESEGVGRIALINEFSPDNKDSA